MRFCCDAFKCRFLSHLLFFVLFFFFKFSLFFFLFLPLQSPVRYLRVTLTVALSIFILLHWYGIVYMKICQNEWNEKKGKKKLWKNEQKKNGSLLVLTEVWKSVTISCCFFDNNCISKTLYQSVSLSNIFILLERIERKSGRGQGESFFLLSSSPIAFTLLYFFSPKRNSL